MENPKSEHLACPRVYPNHLRHSAIALERRVHYIVSLRSLQIPMKSPDYRTPCILIADDQADVLEALRFLVKGEGYLAESVNSPAAAIDAVESRDFDAVDGG